MKPKNIYKVLLLFAVLAILYFIHRQFLAKEGFVSSAEDFEKNISGEKALVLFHADWCGHCKKFMPEWDKISKEINSSDNGVKLMKVECGDASNNQKHVTGGGFQTSSSDHTGFKILAGSGNLTQHSIQIYGVANTERFGGF